MNQLHLRPAYLSFIFAGISFFGAVLILLWRDISLLANLIKQDDAYTHIAIVPLMCLFLIWSSRARFSIDRRKTIHTLLLLFFTLLVVVLPAFFTFQDPFTALAVRSLGVVIICIATFAYLCGISSVPTSAFALLLLFLAIPLPPALLHSIIRFLQNGSALIVDWIFTLTGQTYIRDGLDFHLENISIHIAPECSGIRSTMALILTLFFASEMMLKRWWTKTFAVLAIIPLSILKNAIRISTISLLAQHVDKAFLTHSWLHKGGGVVFYALVLLLFFPYILVLSRLELQPQPKTRK